MSYMLTLLAWSPALFALYMGIQATLYRLEHGVEFAATGRDNEPEAKSPYLQRAEKALRNFLETYGVFIALAVAAELSHRAGGPVLWGAGLYFAARLVYLPLYLLGIKYLRSLVWIVSAIGLAMMFVGILL